MARGKRWTTEEDTVLIDQVKRHANNITEGLRKASSYLDRTQEACAFRWYSVLSKNPNTEVCFVTIGLGTRSVNRKTVLLKQNTQIEKTPTSWFKRVLSFFK
jgi:hypothetical protein